MATNGISIESQNHRVIAIEKDPQDHLVQPSEHCNITHPILQGPVKLHTPLQDKKPTQPPFFPPVAPFLAIGSTDGTSQGRGPTTQHLFKHRMAHPHPQRHFFRKEITGFCWVLFLFFSPSFFLLGLNALTSVLLT